MNTKTKFVPWTSFVFNLKGGYKTISYFVSVYWNEEAQDWLLTAEAHELIYNITHEGTKV